MRDDRAHKYTAYLPSLPIDFAAAATTTTTTTTTTANTMLAIHQQEQTTTYLPSLLAAFASTAVTPGAVMTAVAEDHTGIPFGERRVGETKFCGGLFWIPGGGWLCPAANNFNSCAMCCSSPVNSQQVSHRQ